MSIDLQRLRNKLDALKNPKKGGGKFEKKTWPAEIAKDGDSKVIRMMQYPFAQDPIVELWFHYGIGKGPSIICPRLVSGKTCPCCEFAFELKKGGDMETAKKLFPKQRMFIPMIDRTDPTFSVKYWGFGKEIYQKLIESLLSEDYGTFLDPINGLDAEVKWSKRGESGFIVPSVSFKRKESKLADTDQKIQEIMKSIPSIEEVFKPLTTAEINERLSEWINLSENDGGEQSRGAATEEDSDSGEKSGPGVKDLDAAFEEALRD